MGWLVGSSTRTPASSISIMATSATVPAAPDPGKSETADQEVRIGLERRDVVHRHDVGEVAIALLEVEAVSDHETVRTIEARVANVQRRDASHRFVEQRADLDRSRG